MTSPGDAAVALARDLVAIDSVNPALVEGGAGEREIVELLDQRLSRSGFETVVVHPVGPAAGAGRRVSRVERPSLVAIAPGPPDAPWVVLNGHLDTVGVTGMDAPFSPRIEDGRLFGRGAADMKAGVAALVVAAEELVRLGAPVRPVLALVADEEDASLGSEAVIDALPGMGLRPEVCLIAEPTSLALARSLRGFAVVRVDLTGVAAHSSQPDLGVNAVTHLGRLLTAVEDAAEPVRERGGDLMVTMVRGGQSAFVIPDEASCLVERRTVPGERSAAVLDEITDLLDPSWRATATLVAHREPWCLDSEGPASALAARLGGALGTTADFDAPYWMEAPLWQQVAPTLVCGPSGGGLHADVEWVELEQVHRFTAALIETLADVDAWRSHAD